MLRTFTCSNSHNANKRVTGTKKNQCDRITAINELNRQIDINKGSSPLSEIGIEILKDAVAILEGRNRISKLQSLMSS